MLNGDIWKLGGIQEFLRGGDAIPFMVIRLPKGLEIQMLDLEWVKLNTKKGERNHLLQPMCMENFLELGG